MLSNCWKRAILKWCVYIYRYRYTWYMCVYYTYDIPWMPPPRMPITTRIIHYSIYSLDLFSRRFVLYTVYINILYNIQTWCQLRHSKRLSKTSSSVDFAPIGPSTSKILFCCPIMFRIQEIYHCLRCADGNLGGSSLFRSKLWFGVFRELQLQNIGHFRSHQLVVSWLTKNTPRTWNQRG